MKKKLQAVTKKYHNLYDRSLHLQATFLELNFTKSGFPISEELADQVHSLPIYPHQLMINKYA